MPIHCVYFNSTSYNVHSRKLFISVQEGGSRDAILLPITLTVLVVQLDLPNEIDKCHCRGKQGEHYT